MNTTHASDDVTIWDEVTKISIHAVHKTSPVAVFKAMSYKYMLHILHSDVQSFHRGNENEDGY